MIRILYVWAYYLLPMLLRFAPSRICACFMVWLRDVVFPVTISDQHVCLWYFANSNSELCNPPPSSAEA